VTGAGTAVEVPDTDTLIEEWRSSPRRVEQIAAVLAAEVSGGRYDRWDELPSVAVLADEHGVTERTVSSVKGLLAVHGFLVKENGRYYVA
jgi:DNA-binding transcriptional regulator YhcF (GntR family)